MGFLTSLIGSARGRDDAPKFWADEAMAYDPDLIAHLKEEHRELVTAFTAIKMAASECRFQELPVLLLALKQTFQTHIMQENVKLYVYVQRCCALDAVTSDFVFELRRDMNGIARTLVKFVNAHTATVPTFDTIGMFKAELDLICSLLLRRVRLEENRLYTLYKPT